MPFFKPLKGYIRAKITSADIPGVFKIATEKNILLNDIIYDNDLTVCLTVSRKEFPILQKHLRQRGDQCEADKKWGLAWALLHLKERTVLLLGILLLTAFTVFLPTRIFFVEVKGNDAVPQRWILEKAEENGLRFGCRRSDIKSEKMKNIFLRQIPELDWVGITTAGCVATIEVREKNDAGEIEQPVFAVGHIVASCDGIVDSVTVVNGISLCKPGQAVRSGQILISGYEDCGIVIKASKAEGEIFAKTFHSFQMVTPVLNENRTEKIRANVKYSLQIGKKLINFQKDSGISPAGCVKMYERKYLTLPGGFQLPIALVRQEEIYYKTDEQDCGIQDDSWLEKSAEEYILCHMSAGEILSSQTTLTQEDQLWYLYGAYACREQIGKKKIEEIYNGTNS